MNPLQVLQGLINPPASSSTGTVIGQSGDRIQVRTAQGIKLVATDRKCTLGASLTMNAKGEVTGVLDHADLVPSYKV